MNSRSILIPAVLLTLSMTSLASAPVRGLWRAIAPLPSPRQEVAVTALGKDVYVLGGLTPGGATNGVAVFDAEAGTWSEAAGLPRVLHHGAAAQVGGRIYSVGGFLGTTFSPTDEVFELDPSAGNWSEISSLPSSRGALAAAVIDGCIYAAGGAGLGGDTSSLFRFDPAAGTWETLPSMSMPRNHHAAAAIDGKLYVVGGRRFGSNLNSLEIFDPATASWEAGPPLPTARSGIAAVAVGGRLFVFGGEIPGVFEEVEVFDPGTGRWSSLTPMPLPRHGIGAAVFLDRIIIPGGATVEGFGSTAQSDEFLVLRHHAVLAQFADSPEIVSQLLAANFKATPVEVVAELRGQDGALLPIPLDEGPAAGQTGFTLQPGQSRTLSTPGATQPPAVGFAQVFSNQPLLAHVLFSSDFGFAGVLASVPLRAFGVPVQRSARGNVNSGIALAEVSETGCTIRLSLLDSAGNLIATAEIALAALGHVASFIDQLFPGLDVEFEGSLTGTADCRFAAMAILLRGNQMATLPVQSLEAGM